MTATAVVIVGTVLVDAGRLWLLLVPASFLLTAYSAGALVDRAVGGLLRGPERSPLLDVAVHVGVGLACLALLATASAMCGVFWVAGIVTLPLLAYGALRVSRACCDRPMTAWSLPAVAGGLALGCTWLLAWLWATIPPIFYDELAYHLVIPQRALATGELLTTPWVFFTLMPHVSDLLLAWGMAFGGDLGARATVFALWVACTLGAWGLAEAAVWPQATPWGAPFVACALAASPTLWFHATLPFAETCLSAAVVTAGAVLAAPQTERRPWVALGLILGLAATAKLSGLFWVVAVLAAAMVVGWSRWDLSRAALIACASLAPWWARAFYLTGNPIYPMRYNVLGGSFWSNESQARFLADLPYSTGGLGLRGVLRLPLDLVLHPERFGSASDSGVVAVAAVCLTLSLPAVSRLLGLGARALQLSDSVAIFVLISGTAWVITTPTTRYFAPALVIGLSVLACAALHLPRTAQILAFTVLLAGGIWGAYRFVNQHALVFSSYDVATGRETAEHYLASNLDHFGAARFVRENLPADARLLFIGETRPYYFTREAVAPSAYDRHPLYHWVLESSSPEALAARLVAEGFTHVVLNIHEFKRLHDKYGVLAFSGAAGEADDRRLKALPGVLRLLYANNGVYVFEVPRPIQ